jgi:hypothetical protein
MGERSSCDGGAAGVSRRAVHVTMYNVTLHRQSQSFLVLYTVPPSNLMMAGDHRRHVGSGELRRAIRQASEIHRILLGP